MSDCSYEPDGKDRCQESATTKRFGIPLCESHATIVYNESRILHARRLLEAMKTTGVSHMPGWTYIARLPNDNLKIGYTSKVNLGCFAGEFGLSKRWQAAETAHGGLVIPLAVMPGGYTLETELHDKFDDLRLKELKDEQFKPDERLLEFATANGVAHEVRPEVTEYIRWRQNRPAAKRAKAA